MSSIQVEKVVKEPVPPPATMTSASPLSAAPATTPSTQRAEQVDGEDPEPERAAPGWSERRASSAKRATAIGPPSRPTAIQAPALTRLPARRLLPRMADKVAAPAEQEAGADEQQAAGDRRRRVGGRQADGARVDHLEELELEGGEGGQGAAEAGGEEGEAVALGAVAAQGADEEPSSRAPAMLTAKVAQGQEAAPCGSGLGEPDPGEGADHAAGVDRRQAAGIESGLVHLGPRP